MSEETARKLKSILVCPTFFWLQPEKGEGRTPRGGMSPLSSFSFGGISRRDCLLRTFIRSRIQEGGGIVSIGRRGVGNWEGGVRRFSAGGGGEVVFGHSGGERQVKPFRGGVSREI